MEIALTTRSQEALAEALRRATVGGNPHVEPVHLLAALLAQSEGTSRPLLQAVGVEPGPLTLAADQAIAGLPSASGPSVGAPQTSRALLTALSAAKDEADALGDQYVSTEHLLLALTADAGFAGQALQRAGAPRQAVLDALPQIRGGATVTPRAATTRSTSTAST
jgi:ATP-dependent Clp protease ATP-binding subunit ClpB